ncbi:hypothetical protein HRbin08_00488 [bacterium HR08]|nr:hypothetical protein HRbin08_00488 [bacterium HR08]
MGGGRMRIWLRLDSRQRWSFQAEPEGEEERRPPVLSQGIAGRLWPRLLAEYHRARRAIEMTERMAWMRALLRKLEARVDPSESLLRRMRTAAEIVLLHPESLSAPLVRRRFFRFLRRRARAHARGAVLNALLLPVTAAMAILPGPNVFFAWNAYRLIAHLLAWRGARRVLRQDCPVHVRAASEEGIIVSRASPQLHAEGI